MKRILIPILVIGVLLLGGCGAPSPYQQGMVRYNDQWITQEEYARIANAESPAPASTPAPATTPAPEPTPTPLTYKVVESYTDTDSYKERRQIVIGGVVFQDEVVEVFYPIACVTLKNTDSVYGTFRVQFTFYALDKSDAGILGGLPDFKFEDYLAAKDPDSYLDNLDWDKLDWGRIMIHCEEYNRQENITLQPGETGTVTASVQDIDINKMAWKWEYTITEPTKTVEK